LMFRTAVRYKKIIHGPLSQEKLTKLRSGLFVASAKHNRPHDMVHLALVHRVGPLYETRLQVGLVPLISAIAYHKRNEHGSLNMKLPLRSMASHFIRHDFLSACLCVPREKSELALKYLTHFAALKESDLDVLLKDGSAPPLPSHPALHAEECVKRAAYGISPLAHTIHPPFSSSSLKCTDDDARHTANNTVLYGVNFNHDKLCAFAEANIPVCTDLVPGASDSYVGGERRQQGPEKSAFVAIDIRINLREYNSAQDVPADKGDPKLAAVQSEL
ncbi:hypothetical protein PMAYCL1PPCAC_20440, partial [Pristionchus mayeri]